MDETIQAFLSILKNDGKSWDEALKLIAPLTNSEEAMLEMTEWVLQHPKAERQEMMTARAEVMRKYQK